MIIWGLTALIWLLCVPAGPLVYSLSLSELDSEDSDLYDPSWRELWISWAPSVSLGTIFCRGSKMVASAPACCLFGIL